MYKTSFVKQLYYYQFQNKLLHLKSASQYVKGAY